MIFKKIHKSTAAVLVVLLTTSTFTTLTPVVALAAGVPATISYQGRLSDSSGNLLGGSGTAYFFKFSIWDSPTVGSGNRLWPSSSPTAVSLNVRQGVFTANLGDTANGFPDALTDIFNNRTMY